MSARTCTRGWQTSSRTAGPHLRRSSPLTGPQRAAAEMRSRLRSKRRASRRRSTAWRRRSPISNERSRCGRPCPTRPSSLGSTSSSSARGRRRSPAKRGARHVQSSSHGERSGWSPSATRYVRRASTTGSATTSTRADGRTLRSPRSSAWSSSCRPNTIGRARPGARRARARVDARLALRRVAHDVRAGARSRPRGRRARSGARSAARTSAETSPTSAAQTKVSDISGER